MVENTKLRNIEEYKSFKYDKVMYELEEVFSKMVLSSENKELHYPGYCQVCHQEVNFLVDNKCTGENNNWVNFRERMVCPICQLNNRQRVMVDMVLSNIDKNTDHIYLYEQITPIFNVLKKQITHIIGSEYLGENIEPGSISPKGIRHEDAMNLSFSDESFEMVISNDVFEHVVDIQKTLNEAYRVLKTGGRMLASVPFDFGKEKTEIRARLVNGQIEYMKDKVFHGNPLGGGSLVFYDFGWDFMDMLKKAGFKDAYFVPYYSVKSGNIGVNMLINLVAVK